jgi:hypothetical protein
MAARHRLKLLPLHHASSLPPISCRILTSTQNDCPYNRSSAPVPNSDTLSSLVLVFHPPPCFVTLFASTFCDRIARIIMAFTIEPAAAAIQVRVYCRRVCAFGLFEVPSRGWTELFYSQSHCIALSSSAPPTGSSTVASFRGSSTWMIRTRQTFPRKWLTPTWPWPLRHWQIWTEPCA